MSEKLTREQIAIPEKTLNASIAVREVFPDVKLRNSTEFPDWKERAKKYRGKTFTFKRQSLEKWMGKCVMPCTGPNCNKDAEEGKTMCKSCYERAQAEIKRKCGV